VWCFGLGAAAGRLMTNEGRSRSLGEMCPDDGEGGDLRAVPRTFPEEANQFGDGQGRVEEEIRTHPSPQTS